MATRLNLSVTEVDDDDSISVENNTSDVLVVLEIITDGGTYNQSGDTSGYISLDGVQIKNLNGAPVYKNTRTELYRGTHTVKHNADGSKSITVKAAFDVNTSVRWIYAEQTLALTTIPRASVLQVPEFTLGAQGTMAVKRYVESYVHTLEYTFGDLSGVIVEESADTQLQWTPPLEDFAWQIPDDVEGYGTLTLTTYNGRGGEIGSNKYPFKVLLPADVIPSVVLTVTPASDVVPKSWNVAVQGKSRMEFSADATALYGATIEEYAFSFAGQTVVTEESTGQTALLTKAGSYVPEITVKDSRKRPATVKLPAVTVYEYTVPTIGEAKAYRSDGVGNENDEGNSVTVLCRATGADINGKNTVTAQVKYRAAGGSWPENPTAIPNGQQTVLEGYFSNQQTYEVELSAVDALGGGAGKTALFTIATAEVAFHLKNGGKAAAFGKYAEGSDLLQCAWNAEFQQNVSVNGDLTLSGGSLSGLGDPQNENDAVPLGYFNASVQDHFNSTDNPHGVTPAQICALPAIESADYPGCFYRRVNGVQEWLNPPMLIGVEYRTTERYNGKPVYWKLVDFGNLLDTNFKTVAHGISNVEDIVELLCSARSGSSVVYIPTTSGKTYDDYTGWVQLTWAAGATETWVGVMTNANRSSWTAKFFIKVTKTTD